MKIPFLFFCLLGTFSLAGAEVRIKNLARLKGKRENPLIGGVGLVVGLPGTGDSAQSLLTQKMVKKLFRTFGLNLKDETVQTQNIALVSVTGSLPEFARQGDEFSVTLSSLGDSRSLHGGELLITELKGPDQKIYGLAKGKVQIPGRFSLEAVETGAFVVQATVEKEYPTTFIQNNRLRFTLKNPDFTTAQRMVQTINAYLKGFFAQALDSRTIDVICPKEYGSENQYVSQMVNLVSDLEQLKVETDQAAIVVVSRKTQTITFGGRSEVSPVILSHGILDLEVGENAPPPVLEDLAKGLQRLGATSEDLISIIQALQASGAVNAQLKIID